MSKNATAQVLPVQTEEKPVMEVVYPEKNKQKTDLQEKAEDVQALPTAKEVLKPLTIDELKRKVELLTRYAQKHGELTEKRKQVENFIISHDKETATVMVHDAQGEVFQSNSPKTIGKLIEFWLEEFTTAISETESKMREIA